MLESFALMPSLSGGVASIGLRIVRRCYLVIVAVAGSLALQLAASHALALTVEVGETSIVIPEPNGYENVGDSSPEMSQLAAALTPPTNRLLAVFASQEAVAEVLNGNTPVLPRYMLVQSSRQIESVTVSRVQFTQLRDRTRQQQAVAIEQMTRSIGPFLEDASGELSTRIGADLNLAIGESVPLGVFLDRDDAIGFAMITENRISADGQEISYPVVATTLLVNVKNKILFAYVYSSYEDADDVAWARATSRRWVEEIVGMN